MRIFKTLFLIFSFIYVISLNGLSTKFLKNSFYIYLLCVLVLFLSFFSEDIFSSLYKSLSFIYPFLYIVYSINYLLRFGAIRILLAISAGVSLVYFLVPISFIFFGTGFTTLSIYGDQDSGFFVSNHYGWASVLFILSSITILQLQKLNGFLNQNA